MNHKHDWTTFENMAGHYCMSCGERADDTPDEDNLITCDVDGYKYAKGLLCGKCHGGGKDRRATK